jgi:hypothetical protein
VKTGHVDDDILVTQVTRQPAPAIHVEPDSLALRLVACRCRGERFLEGGILRMRGKKAVQRLCEVVLGKRVSKQCVLLGRIKILVDNPPVYPGRLLDMAKRKIGRQKVEALGRGRRENRRVSGIDRSLEASWIIIRRIETLCRDLPDVGNQGERARRVPNRGRKRRGKRSALGSRRLVRLEIRIAGSKRVGGRPRACLGLNGRSRARWTRGCRSRRAWLVRPSRRRNCAHRMNLRECWTRSDTADRRNQHERVRTPLNSSTSAEATLAIPA